MVSNVCRSSTDATIRVHLFSRLGIKEFKDYCSIGRSCIMTTRLSVLEKERLISMYCYQQSVNNVDKGYKINKIGTKIPS